ncbi:hypothetical protein B0I37DRAFT_357032 [Chaetomium sp. MPI-CAGE-AT-0009]|nr:hypothetical protein B0I37DRAFT_357032 [Chaetomium sp. MPI-CAGE-AT-0009]
MKELLSSTKEVTRKEEFQQSESFKGEFVITAGDQLYFYQRVFRGPGLSCALDVTETSSNPSLEDSVTDVEMTVITRPRRFIQTMDVAYGKGEAAAPDDRIRELRGKSDDINHGLKGDYVWMVPKWTYDSDEAATGFEIRTQESPMEGWKDLAAGAGGHYRYVYSNHNSNNVERVVDARLIRSDSGVSAEEQLAMLSKLGSGWVAGTRDINDGRKGSYLYLAYKLF